MGTPAEGGKQGLKWRQKQETKTAPYIQLIHLKINCWKKKKQLRLTLKVSAVHMNFILHVFTSTNTPVFIVQFKITSCKHERKNISAMVDSLGLSQDGGSRNI